MSKGCEEYTKKHDLHSACCSSCHEDADYGYYDLIWIDEDGGYAVCCALSNEKREKSGEAV